MREPSYTGASKLRLDERGRLAVPKSFRHMLSGEAEFILTAHPHGCLAIYGAARFADIREQMGGRGNLSYFDSHLEELVLGSAEALQLDSAERFLIGAHLRNHAGIGRDIRLFNLPDSVRLWSEERWTQKHALLTARLQDAELSETWQTLRL
ncbi:MAG: division/cell wall cluster transcriptional repressor MraZ [Gammaproteobacteria bacterium]